MSSPDSKKPHSVFSQALGFTIGAGGAYGALWFYELNQNLGLVAGACFGLGILGAYFGPAIVHVLFELF